MRSDNGHYAVLDTFAGIGGFSIGLERTGKFRTAAFCEKDAFCQRVLGKRYPGVPIIEDIHDVSSDALCARGVPRIDILTAGFPCQPFSKAGKRRGIHDERFLWPELFRVIADVKPRVVILENSEQIVHTHRGLVFAGILYDLFKAGYDAEWAIVPASDFGAPHIRDRIWITAYPHRQRHHQSKTGQSAPDPKRHAATRQRKGRTKFHAVESGDQVTGDSQSVGRPPILRTDLKNRVQEYPGWQTALDASGDLLQRLEQSLGEPALCGVNDGIPYRVDRLRSLGNAVVPQVVEWIGHCILEAGVLR